MNTERDELAEALEDVIEGADDSNYDDMASALIYRGYRKPRVVVSSGELDALLYGSVIRDDFGIVFAKPYNKGNFWIMVGDEGHHEAAHIVLPATVLHEDGKR